MMHIHNERLFLCVKIPTMAYNKEQIKTNNNTTALTSSVFTSITTKSETVTQSKDIKVQSLNIQRKTGFAEFNTCIITTETKTDPLQKK